MLTSPLVKIKEWIDSVKDAGNITFHISNKWISISNYAIVVKPCSSRIFSFYLDVGGAGTSAIALSISEETNSDIAFECHLYAGAGFMLETVSLKTRRKELTRIWGLTRQGDKIDGWFGEPVDKTFCKDHGLPFFDRD